MNPPPPYDLSDDPADEFQGDVHAADIVGPTGEEMPIATKSDTPSIRFDDPRSGGQA